MKRYYSLEQEGREAVITIYGDITSFPWLESDVSSYLLSQQIASLDVDVIHVYINSYGGEVAEGWAIYNALKRHPAMIHTHADGFVCSIASVIFMAGEKRSMCGVSALMIHHPWTCVSGNANELRKEAEDLETMGELSARAYLTKVNIGEEKLKEMLNAETWITPEKALEMGFATEIVDRTESGGVSQSVRKQVLNRLTGAPDQTAEAVPDMDRLVEQIAGKVAAALHTEFVEQAAGKPSEPREGAHQTETANRIEKFFMAL